MASHTIHRDPEFGRARAALDITIQAEGEAIVLAVEGEVDMSTVSTLRICLEHSAAESSGPIVVDLAGVTFLDSTGLAALVRASKDLVGFNRTLAVRSPSSFAGRLLEMTGLGHLLEPGTEIAAR